MQPFSRSSKPAGSGSRLAGASGHRPKISRFVLDAQPYSSARFSGQVPNAVQPFSRSFKSMKFGQYHVRTGMGLLLLAGIAAALVMATRAASAARFLNCILTRSGDILHFLIVWAYEIW